MATIDFGSAQSLLNPTERESLTQKWGWIVGLGGLVGVIGLYAIGNSFTATIVSVLTLGWLMIIAGICHLALTFSARSWSVGFTQLLVGALYLIVGPMLLRAPVAGAATLTLMIGAFLACVGAARLVAAIVMRVPAWGWTAVNGLVTAALGILIVGGWPDTALWVIGLYLGIDLAFSGAGMIALGLTLRHWRSASTFPSTSMRQGMATS